MTVEAGSHQPDSCGQEQATINKITVNLTKLNRALRRNRRHALFVAIPSLKQVGSTLAISFSVKKQTLPGGSGSKEVSAGITLPPDPGMPSDASP